MALPQRIHQRVLLRINKSLLRITGCDVVQKKMVKNGKKRDVLVACCLLLVACCLLLVDSYRQVLWVRCLVLGAWSGFF